MKPAVKQKSGLSIAETYPPGSGRPDADGAQAGAGAAGELSGARPRTGGAIRQARRRQRPDHSAPGGQAGVFELSAVSAGAARRTRAARPGASGQDRGAPAGAAAQGRYHRPVRPRHRRQYRSLAASRCRARNSRARSICWPTAAAAYRWWAGASAPAWRSSSICICASCARGCSWSPDRRPPGWSICWISAARMS